MTVRTTTAQRATWFRRGATLAATVGCALALSVGVAATASAAPVAPSHHPSAGPTATAAGATVTAISPAIQAGLLTQEVDITGTGFTGTSKVTFGGVAASEISVLSDTEIAAVAPNHSNGTVDLVVTTPDGTATLPNGYTYTDASGDSFTLDLTLTDLMTIASVTCPAATPYLTDAGSDEVIGFDPGMPKGGVTLFRDPFYITDKDGQAPGVDVEYQNIGGTYEVHPEVHCTSIKGDGFSTKLDPGQRISGPLAPNPSSSPSSMDQLLPFVINNSNSDLKITKVWRSGTFDDNPNFIDGNTPEAGQVIRAGSQGAVNLRFTTGGQTLHVRMTDNHGDVLETSVAGSSFTNCFKPSYTCANTAGSNLQCHPKTAHMIDSTILQIENA